MPNTREGLAATHHYMSKVIMEVQFPANKEDISAIAGVKVIPLNFGRSMTVDEILSMIIPEKFSCAAEFFGALTATLLMHKLA
jgi:hypothetical protein